MKSIEQRLSATLNIPINNLKNTIALLDEGLSVPFIARYRKERTGALNDTQLRLLENHLNYHRELDARREIILKTIETQQKLTPELKKALLEAENKTTLEDLYLPYKPKRRSKAQIAREQGLEPLAHALLTQKIPPETLAKNYLKSPINNIEDALEGARLILIEEISETAPLIAKLRKALWAQSILSAQITDETQEKAQKFKDYHNFQEPLKRLPSHRILALFRGRDEGILQLKIKPQNKDQAPYEDLINKHFQIHPQNRYLSDTARLAWRTKILPSLQNEIYKQLKEQADKDAIAVFAKNLHHLLLAPPAGQKRTLGLDPGFKNGIKCASIDETGKILSTFIIYLHQSEKAQKTLIEHIKKDKIEHIAIGNGTASRETEQLTKKALKESALSPKPQIITISEAGASIYSASALASAELPHLDVSLRGAVSIARRLQDPLAELVKIEPKSIGVGQYQHDVNQNLLEQSLKHVVEDAVNAVGVDLNTASAALLRYIAGLNQSHAENIIAHRETHGPFKNRQELLSVKRFGAKAFEQSAGFLRIQNGDNPLDKSAVHPESYPIVERICQDLNRESQSLIGDKKALSQIPLERYCNQDIGLLTLKDIIKELEKPGRDPRGEFKNAQFDPNIQEIKDLKAGLILEGVISNVANFGAFVDIGVHQDGLIHISELSERYVDNPHDIVKTGDIVKVRVLDIDQKRKRISLSLRLKEKT